MACNIEMPQRTHEDFGDSLAKLIYVVRQITECTDDEVILNFSNAKMLNPFFLGGLACVVNRLDGIKKFTLKYNTGNGISSYINTIYFPKAFAPVAYKGNIDFNALERYKAKTYIPIVSFKTGSAGAITIIREKVLNAVSDLLKNQLKFSEKERMPLAYFLGEITDNINEHSNAAEGYVFAQYYPNSNYLDLCICDAGQGIYQSYLNNPKFNPVNEAEAVKWALSGKSTKDRAEARGFGITTTRNMLVNGLRGKLFLWSGHTIFIQTAENEAIVSLNGGGCFQGTFVALRLPTVLSGSFDFYRFVE